MKCPDCGGLWNSIGAMERSGCPRCLAAREYTLRVLIPAMLQGLDVVVEIREAMPRLTIAQLRGDGV